jgi:AraC family transcriptional regulator
MKIATISSYDNLQRAATLFLAAARLALQGEHQAVQDHTKRAIDLLRRNSGDLGASSVQRRLPFGHSAARFDARSIRLFEYIESNLASRLRVDDLAGDCGYSMTYFNSWFKRRFGMPPKTYIRARRIELAKSLMLETPMPLCEIALSCGMADQAHFTRLFRKFVGETPAKWRSVWRSSTACSRNPLIQTLRATTDR